MKHALLHKKSHKVIDKEIVMIQCLSNNRIECKKKQGRSSSIGAKM